MVDFHHLEAEEVSVSDPDAITEQEYQTWQSAADNYADNLSPVTALSGQLPILREIGQIDNTCDVLEIGCGPGDLTMALSEISASVTGIDLSDNMVAIARKRFPQFRFEVADAVTMPFEDNTFDVAVSNYTAHHFARPDVAFAEARRVLKPGGRLAVVMPIQSEQLSWFCVMSAIADEIPQEEVPGGPLVPAEQPEELAHFIEAAGFRDVGAEKRVKPLHLRDSDILARAGWDFMMLHTRPQDMQDRLRSKIAQNVEAYRQDDGTFLFPDKVLVAYARK